MRRTNFDQRALRPADESLKESEEFVGALDLPFEIADRLDVSVREEYRRLWELSHYEDDGPQEHPPKEEEYG